MTPDGFAIALATNFPELVEAVATSLGQDGPDRIACVLTLASRMDTVGPAAERHGIPVVALPVPAGSFRLDAACRSSEAYDAELRSVVADLTAAHGPDLLMTFGFPVVPGFLIESTTRGAVNVHPSDLPSWRGLLPIEAMVFAEASSLRVTAHHLTTNVDEGAVVARSRPFPVAERTSTTALWSGLVERCFPDFTRELLDALRRGASLDSERPASQTPDAFAVKPAADGTGNAGVLGRVRIAWSLDTAADLEVAVRAFDGGMTPSLRLYTDYRRRPWYVESVEVRSDRTDAAAGTILGFGPDGAVDCATRDGVIVRLGGRFRPVGALPDPELEVGASFASTSPIALMTGFALKGLERMEP